MIELDDIFEKIKKKKNPCDARYTLVLDHDLRALLNECKTQLDSRSIAEVARRSFKEGLVQLLIRLKSES